jgi:hypothetical protein
MLFFTTNPIFLKIIDNTIVLTPLNPQIPQVSVFARIRLGLRRILDRMRGRETISTIKNIDNALRRGWPAVAVALGVCRV